MIAFIRLRIFCFPGFYPKIYRNIILPVVLYGCETWSLKMWEERRLRLFENNVLRTMFGSKRNEVTESGENYIMRSLMICILQHIFFW